MRTLRVALPRARRDRMALVLAGLAAIVLVVALWLAGGGDAARTTIPAGEPMFPGLAAELTDARRVEIAQGGNSLAIVRGDVAHPLWTLPDHGDYPIDPRRLHALLAALTELRLLEPRTADPDAFAKLGLDDPRGAGATGTLIRVLGADGTPIAAVIAGHGHLPDQSTLGDATVFVRRPGDRQTWLAKGGLAAPVDGIAWLDTGIVDIDHASVGTVVSTREGAQPLAMASQDGRLTLTDPPSHPPLNQFRLDDMARALERLTLLDVRPAAAAPGSRIGVATVTTHAGLAVRVTVNEDNGAMWLLLSPQGPGSEVVQARVGGWAYRVDPARAAALLPRLADLIAYGPPPPASSVPVVRTEVPP